MLVRVGDQSRELVHVGDQSRVLAIMHLDACLLAIRKGVGDPVKGVGDWKQEICWRLSQKCVGDGVRNMLAMEHAAQGVRWARRDNRFPPAAFLGGLVRFLA